MKDINELMARIDGFEPLPVSEETLGAYLEGTLPDAVADSTAELISSDPGLIQILNDAAVSYDSVAPEEATSAWDIYEGDYGYWELGLPPILYPDNIETEDERVEKDELSDGSDSLSHLEGLYIKNIEDNSDNNNLNTDIMTENKKTIIYGEAAENLKDKQIEQPDDHSCALRSQQIILRDFGIDIPFKDLEQIALDQGVYTNEGTYTYDIGKVLQLAGVEMHQTIGNTVEDLINELAQGHRVIVSVDANELWHNNGVADELRNWFNDVFGKQGGNHALIVAGIEVDPIKPNNSKVILTDPGAGHLRIEYPMKQFQDAWGDSRCFMAATDNAAPYQYDAATGMEIPSNFAVQQYINDFVANNSYQLSPDRINVPEGYQPAFTGHIDVVGDVDYETFKANYDRLLERQIPSYKSVEEQIEEAAEGRESAQSHIGEDIHDVSTNDAVIQTTDLVGTYDSNYNENDLNDTDSSLHAEEVQTDSYTYELTDEEPKDESLVGDDTDDGTDDDADDDIDENY